MSSDGAADISAVSENLRENSLEDKLSFDKGYHAIPALEYYFLIMKCLSVLGVIMFVLSIYLIVFVPVKLSLNTRFGVLGHAIASGFCQITLTIGTIPVFILPCPSGYPNGVLTYLGMKTTDQTVLQFILLLSMGWFTSYLALVRAFAVRVHFHKRWKDRIQISYSIYFVFHCCIFYYLGINVVDYGEEGLALCIKEFTTAPLPEVHFERAVYFSIEKDIFIFLLMLDIIFVVFSFAVVALTSVIILLINLRAQARTSTSSKFLKFQKSFTSVIFFLTFCQFFGFAIPCAGCVFSVATKFHMPTIVCSINFILLGGYPIIGNSLILIVTPAYKSKLQAMSCSLINLFRTSGRMNVVYNIPINLNNVEC